MEAGCAGVRPRNNQRARRFTVAGQEEKSRPGRGQGSGGVRRIGKKKSRGKKGDVRGGRPLREEAS